MHVIFLNYLRRQTSCQTLIFQVLRDSSLFITPAQRPAEAATAVLAKLCFLGFSEVMERY